MATTTTHKTARTRNRGIGVDLDALVCPGCAEPVDAGPTGGSDGPGFFCHRDGSELCPDSSGTAGEPVEFESPRWPA